MAKITFIDTKLDGLKIVVPFFATDNRGFFMKAYAKEIFRKAGIETDIAETFESFSKRGVLRGLHFQQGQSAQAKLVRVLSGEVYDVCVDIRQGSATFGHWVGEYLSGENRRAFYIPKGFAHGFLVTGGDALMSYTCSGAYSQGTEGGIRYDDPELGIDWPFNDVTVIQSAKDAALPFFHSFKEMQQQEK